MDAWPRYHYVGTLIRVVDGDTFWANIDEGFDDHRYISLRIAGMNTPEMHGPDRLRAIAARDRLAELLGDRPLYIKTDKDRQSFARYVARVYLDPAGTLDVAEMLISEGLAERYPSKV